MNSFESLKDFFDNREVAHKATKPLGKKAIGEIIFKDDESKSYTFRKEGKFSSIFDETPNQPDFTMKLEEGAVKKLVEFQSENVGDFGIKFFQIMKAKKEGENIDVKLHIGIFKIMTKGYLKVLLLGGPVVKSAAKKIFSKK
jgi:hypothetical protein